MKTVLRRTATGCLLIAGLFFTLSACGSAEEESGFRVEGEGIGVESPWVRPAGQGRISAGYFLITNFEETADTLTGVSSTVSGLTEIHESYETDDGMVGMREVTAVPLPEQSTVRFEPGGLHIMFIQLQEDLQKGDEIELQLEFARSEPLTLSVPVRQ